MKKEKKIKTLELLIMITIILSLAIISTLAYKYLHNDVNQSTTYKVIDYSANKITKYKKDLEESYIYNIPYQEYINKEHSYYNIFVKSTDNIINGLVEIIVINYYEELPIEESTEETEVEEIQPININTKRIKTYCDSFNEIEYDYTYSCTYENNTLTIRNDFKIPITTMNKSKKEKTWNIEEGTKLSDYIKELEQNNIDYQFVNEIK